MKKIISVLIILATIACLFASCKAKQSNPVTSGDYTYVLLEDNTAKITKYSSEENIIELNIPDNIDGNTVTVIGEGAFAGLNNLTVVNFPSTLKKIEQKAFEGSSVKNAFLHKSTSLEEIEPYAFSECHNLVQVDISSSLETLHGYVFYYCDELKAATFRGNTTVEQFAFDACPKVKIYCKADANNVKRFADEYYIEYKELGSSK